MGLVGTQRDGQKKKGGRSHPLKYVFRRDFYFFGVLGCSGLCELPCSPALAPLFMSMPPVDDAVPETFTLSTTLRLPAKDCAIRLASSRSFCEGAVPLSVMLSAETSTEMLLLVSVGSFLNAVWMSLFTWAEDSAAPVVPAVELVCGAGAATELLGEVLAEALAPVVELVLA